MNRTPSVALALAVGSSWLAADTLKVAADAQAPGTVEVRPVLEAWEEATIGGERVPDLGAPVAAVPIAASDRLDYLTIDLTALVRDWADGVLDNRALRAGRARSSCRREWSR